MLKRMVEPLREVFALLVILPKTGFPFAKAIRHAFQRVLDGGDGARRAVAHAGFVFGFSVDDEVGPLVELAESASGESYGLFFLLVA